MIVLFYWDLLYNNNNQVIKLANVSTVAVSMCVCVRSLCYCELAEKLNTTWAIQRTLYFLLFTSNRRRCFSCLPYRNQFELEKWGELKFVVDLIDHFMFLNFSPLHLSAANVNIFFSSTLTCSTENLKSHQRHYIFSTITITMMIFMIIYCTRKCFCVSSLISYHRCTCWIVRFTLIYKM